MIKISDNLSVTVATAPLLPGCRRICRDVLLKKGKKTENDIAEFLLNLHLTLEIGINSMFSAIMYLDLRVERLRDNFPELVENLDRVGFIERVTMFIYFGTFDFSDISLDLLKQHYSIISRLRNFCGVRNALIHGHSMYEITDFQGRNKQTKAFALLTEETIKRQIEAFIQITNSLDFFIRAMVSMNFTDSGKEKMVKGFLTTDFLFARGEWE